ncbi:MAG: hypothetical protein HUJ63_12410 [Enterococcus sp.]|nr:hypothetical protein [Enterococcus sp.]
MPIVKDELSWALDSDVLFQDSYDGAIKPMVSKGLNYTAYLNTFICFLSDDTISTRMQDLIQINMKLNHNREFLISESFIGMNISLDISGNEYSYKKTYYEK